VNTQAMSEKARALAEEARNSAYRRLKAAIDGKERSIWPGGPKYKLPDYLENVAAWGMPDQLRVHLVEFRRAYNAHPARVYCSRATFWSIVMTAAQAIPPSGTFRPFDYEDPFPQGYEVCGVPFFECEQLPFGALCSLPPKNLA
jgi:hypothetical protein